MVPARLARGRAGHGVLLGGQATATTNLPDGSRRLLQDVRPRRLDRLNRTCAVRALAHAHPSAAGQDSPDGAAPRTRGPAAAPDGGLCPVVSVSQQPETLFTQARTEARRK